MDAIFPGQGSQTVGMGKFLYDEFTLARRIFEEASDALQIDVKKLCFEDPQNELFLTENTQPALLTVSTALFRILVENVGFTPQRAAGHSLGEYSALVAAETLGFSEAVKAVRRRGQAMQNAVPVGEGAMLAVLGASDEEVQKICQWAVQSSGVGPLEPANYNAPGQVVASGSARTCGWLRENYSADKARVTARAKFVPLNVSAPFHCSLMKPAEEAMKVYLESLSWKEAKFEVVSNFTAEASRSTAILKQNLISQVTGPVRWNQSINKMKNAGSRRLVEVGCGRVLAGLNKKIDPENLETWNVNNMEDFRAFEKELRK